MSSAAPGRARGPPRRAGRQDPRSRHENGADDDDDDDEEDEDEELGTAGGARGPGRERALRDWRADLVRRPVCRARAHHGLTLHAQCETSCVCCWAAVCCCCATAVAEKRVSRSEYTYSHAYARACTSAAALMHAPAPRALLICPSAAQSAGSVSRGFAASDCSWRPSGRSGCIRSASSTWTVSTSRRVHDRARAAPAALASTTRPTQTDAVGGATDCNLFEFALVAVCPCCVASQMYRDTMRGRRTAPSAAALQ
jgi:hypothetical protein